MGAHAHPMGAMQAGAGHPMGGPGGPGMMQAIHPGVSAPQVTQGPMVTGMAPGPGTPAPGGPMQNPMAMAHLGPQQHMFAQQSTPQMFGGGGMPMTPQQMMIQQRMRLQHQQAAGMPMGMPGAAQNQRQVSQAHNMQVSRSQEQPITQAPQAHPTPAPQNQPPPSQLAQQSQAPANLPAKATAPPTPVTTQPPTHLANPSNPRELGCWDAIVRKFFSPFGTLKQQFVRPETGLEGKTFLLNYASLARYLHAHFLSGIKQILLQSYEHSNASSQTGEILVSCHHASLTYIFHNDVRIATQGSLSVYFDETSKITRLEISADDWKEYLPRSVLIPTSPDQTKDGKPKMAKKNQPQASANQAPHLVPVKTVSAYGVPQKILGWLEVVEVMNSMSPLIDYCNSHISIGPREGLLRIAQESAQNFVNASHAARLQNQIARQANGQIAFPPGMAMNGPNQFASPAMAHLGLPQAQGSPHHPGSVHTPSPAQNPAGGVPMVPQMSAQGSLSGSQGPSTNTSPNVSNKRRRASQIKLEEENAAQGGDNAIKQAPSPPSPTRTLLVGLSGPSCSGKTTLARFLRTVFTIPAASAASTKNRSISAFILHIDDFYKTDKDLDIPLLARALNHVKATGQLPADLFSKEDQNTVGPTPDVPESLLASLREEIQSWLLRGDDDSTNNNNTTTAAAANLYALSKLLDLKLWVSCSRRQMLDRRAQRKGYVTLEAFWEDPPGYAEDLVWPEFLREHEWLAAKREDIVVAPEDGHGNVLPMHDAVAVAVAVADTIDVTIRFSASLPDLPLSISLATHPHANTCTLKQLIRRSLPAESANRRIRLICAGKALLDNDLLTTSLRRRGGVGAGAPTPWLSSTGMSKSTPLRASSAAAVASDKGKTPIRDPVAQQPRIYIHCSIGDLTLPPDELEREARTARGYEATEQSALDDMLLGTAMGFFWPIGCLLWGVREEGVWSTRRKMAVVVGVCLNLVLGLVKFGA
ncbi:hypothetical protein DV738_g4344, partial [Chaetothyriales sp. CBS 135597]